MLNVALNVVRGLCMGAADIVPGVSGGTVALVLGIYTRLIDAVGEGARALGRLAKLDLAGAATSLRAIPWTFIVPLLAGIGLAVLALSHTIERLLEEEPLRMAALFFGLVVGSIAVTAGQFRWDRARLLLMLGTAVVAFFALGLRSGPVQDPGLLLVFGVGAIAICAMILPGVSGSFLLLMLGMYNYVLAAVNSRDLVIIAAFGAGAVLGLAVFSSVLHWALRRYTELVMAALTGLMVGSLRVLWPWPSGTATTTMGLPRTDVLVPIVIAAVGAASVIVVARVATTRQQRSEAVPTAR